MLTSSSLEPRAGMGLATKSGLVWHVASICVLAWVTEPQRLTEHCFFSTGYPVHDANVVPSQLGTENQARQLL